jgi:hypothetical protein
VCRNVYYPGFIFSGRREAHIRSRHTRYVTSIEEYDKLADKLDILPCPHCHVTGCLNRHGKQRRYDERSGKQSVCGARVFCNNRGHMRGCGKTYPVILIERMYRRVVSSSTLWAFLRSLLDGRRTKDAWENCTSAFCLDTGYKLRAAFLKSLSHIRTLLRKLGPPAPCRGPTHPILQTVQHLKNAFRSAVCPVAAFQLRFQQPLLI